MRRDLELDFDPSELVLAPPDRSQLKEMFRRFEFRGLLNRVDELDEALPAAALTPDRGVERAVARGASSSPVPARGPLGIAVDDGRVAVAAGEEVVVSAAAGRGSTAS